MKKIYSMAFALILMLSMASSAFADSYQNTKTTYNIATAYHLLDSDSNCVGCGNLTVSLAGTVTSTTTVSITATASFKSSFSYATNVQWVDTDTWTKTLTYTLTSGEKIYFFGYQYLTGYVGNYTVTHWYGDDHYYNVESDFPQKAGNSWTSHDPQG
ncbi:hypothetical protein LOZ80_30560 [Paenibacillus sp. HWE-109]|uniref:hypothetical protein n=1 Tax=Paenibacillus TaxID=44249 RepID=UPI001566710A|nr:MULTISPECIES: hypothetical protein [Paenibacillus]NQX67828.1 hypothetical protein [Paenibacillus alba]UKS25860.1 hypothetical protein LOZ80_30560 [Paenibacillus sp. HWE-109]